MLPGSYLGDDGTHKLCQCFNSGSQVIKIEIDDCHIGKDGLRSIAHMLSINQRILYIDLRKNKFAMDDVKEFLKHDIKNVQILLLDKVYCENSEIRGLLRDINQIRADNNAVPLNISNQGTKLQRD